MDEPSSDIGDQKGRRREEKEEKRRQAGGGGGVEKLYTQRKEQHQRFIYSLVSAKLDYQQRNRAFRVLSCTMGANPSV